MFILNAKDYCKLHDPISKHDMFPDYMIYLHGKDDTHVYISETYGSTVKYHKSRLLTSPQSDRQFFKLDNRRLYLDEFTDII